MEYGTYRPGRKTSLQVNLEVEQYLLLKQLAVASHVPMAALVREALTQFLQQKIEKKK